MNIAEVSYELLQWSSSFWLGYANKYYHKDDSPGKSPDQSNITIVHMLHKRPA